MIRTAIIFGLLGLAAATALFLWQGIDAVMGAFASAGLGIVWASLFHFLPMLLNARAWQVLLPATRRRPSLVVFYWAVLLRESVNGLLPVARIGGEVVTARLLMSHGLRPPGAVASLVVDVTISIISQFGFALLGLALLALRGGNSSLLHDVIIGLLVAVPVIVVLALVQRIGLFVLLARLFRTLFGDRFDTLVGGAQPLDRAVRRLYRRRRELTMCGAWQLAGWIAGAGEIWIALNFLGRPVGFGDAVIVEALIQALSSGAFVVPGALGIQEGGFLVIGGMIGLPPDIALALALMRRARDILLFAPALIVWQVSLGRRFLARA